VGGGGESVKGEFITILRNGQRREKEKEAKKNGKKAGEIYEWKRGGRKKKKVRQAGGYSWCTGKGKKPSLKKRTSKWRDKEKKRAWPTKRTNE